MAHLRQHPRSPFWYLRTRNLDSGAWEETSTGLRVDSREDTRKAQRKAEAKTIEERRAGTGANSPAFAVWVPDYLVSRKRYRVAWQAIKAFLHAHDLTYPRQIKYAHGEAYIRWRLAHPVHGRPAGHNTALLEIKFLSQLMNEAIRRDFAESNPIARLGIGREAQKVKPELSNADIKKIRAALKHQPEWMATAFNISLYTGCRFGECAISLENIDFAAGTIRIRDSKRKDTDPRKFFTVPMHKKLRPILARLKKRGATVTCELSDDKNGRINKVFKAAGVQASFHSLRVTFVTRCHRGGLSEHEAMRLVNHSSSLIHRVYSRLNVEDVRKAQGKIPLP